MNTGGTDFDYSANLTFTGASLDLLAQVSPGASNTYDLGTSSLYWDDMFVNRWYAGHATSYIDYNTGQMRFTDGTAGAVFLNDLVGSGIDPGDTIELGEVTRLLVDTLLLFGWHIPDSSLFQSSTQIAAQYHYGPDTLYIHEGRVSVTSGSAADFTYNLHYAPGRDDGPTTLYSSARQVTGTEVDDVGEVDTPDNPSIPPGNWMWLTIDASTTKPPEGASFMFIGYEY